MFSSILMTCPCTGTEQELVYCYQTSPLVVALCWGMMPWLPEQMLPGSVYIAEVIE